MLTQTALSTGSGQTGQTTRFEFDPLTSSGHRNLGRLTRRILPLDQSATMRYDGENNLVESISFTYDADGRVLTKQSDCRDARPCISTVYTYAPDGSQDMVTDQRGTTTLSYDEMGRLESKDDPDTGTLSYDYDLAGNRTSVSPPSGEVSYTYDELNRLETVVDPQTGTTRYSYDTVGKLKTVRYPNGTLAEYT